MKPTLAMPPLVSGGVMLSYRCNHACRHCLYRCGPHLPDAWMDMAAMERVFTALAREKRLVDLHLSGGEATLNPDLLVEAIRLAVRKRIWLSYLETNGSFAGDLGTAIAFLERLKKAGLRAILLSVSPYHNEFLPLRKTLICWEAARKVFGDSGVFPWLEHFLPLISKMDIDKTHTLGEFLSGAGMDEGDRRLLGMFPLTPGGRAPKALRKFFPSQPAEAYAGMHCRDILTDTSHFHIDPHGNLFTGHCPGIATARAPDFHPAIDAGNSPAFAILHDGGPYALAREAAERCGFAPRPDGYAGPCDLCYDARAALRRAEPESWPDLTPGEFYAFPGVVFAENHAGKSNR